MNAGAVWGVNVGTDCRTPGLATQKALGLQVNARRGRLTLDGSWPIPFGPLYRSRLRLRSLPASRRSHPSLSLSGRLLRTRLSARSEIPDFLPASWTKPRGKEQVGPTLELSAEDAVMLQLSCLQSNDLPYADHGVEVMYRFASFDPFQRSQYFGPRLDLGQFERFRRLFHHSTYRVLLGHKEHQVLSSFYFSPTRMRQRVRALGLRPGEDEVFEFTLVQREGGSWDGYWFTESLIHDGEGVSRGIAY